MMSVPRKICQGDLVVVKRDVERGNNTMSQFNINNQKLDILKLDRGAHGIVIEVYQRMGWMSKYNVLFSTGQSFWLWEEEVELLSSQP